MRLTDFTDPQPPPVPRPGGSSMHYVAAALHRMRATHGLHKYQSLLQAGNGRDPEVDRVQESLDGLVYEIQRTVEARAYAEALAEFRRQVTERIAHTDGGEVDGLRFALRAFDTLTDPSALGARADEAAMAMISEASGAYAAEADDQY